MKTMVRLGEDVKIQCPISGNPTPIIEWKKGGETIDYTFIRIRTKGRQLRIKKVPRDGHRSLYLQGCKWIWQH